MSSENASSSARRSSVCYASALDAARDIDREIGGKQLAQMPKECARLIVHLKKWIQDGDAAGIRGMERAPLDWTQKLVMAVGECISDQRNGMDALASASWDRVHELWCEQENRSDA